MASRRYGNSLTVSPGAQYEPALKSIVRWQSEDEKPHAMAVTARATAIQIPTAGIETVTGDAFVRVKWGTSGATYEADIDACPGSNLILVADSIEVTAGYVQNGVADPPQAFGDAIFNATIAPSAGVPTGGNMRTILPAFSEHLSYLVHCEIPPVARAVVIVNRDGPAVTGQFIVALSNGSLINMLNVTQDKRDCPIWPIPCGATTLSIADAAGIAGSRPHVACLFPLMV